MCAFIGVVPASASAPADKCRLEGSMEGGTGGVKQAYNKGGRHANCVTTLSALRTKELAVVQQGYNDVQIPQIKVQIRVAHTFFTSDL